MHGTHAKIVSEVLHGENIVSVIQADQKNTIPFPCFPFLSHPSHSIAFHIHSFPMKRTGPYVEPEFKIRGKRGRQKHETMRVADVKNISMHRMLNIT